MVNYKFPLHTFYKRHKNWNLQHFVVGELAFLGTDEFLHFFCTYKFHLLGELYHCFQKLLCVSVLFFFQFLLNQYLIFLIQLQGNNLQQLFYLNQLFQNYTLLYKSFKPKYPFSTLSSNVPHLQT